MAGPSWTRLPYTLLLSCLLWISPNPTTAYTPLSDETLKLIPSAGADFDIHSGSLLAPILIPRVPGTPGSLAVQKHFADFFANQLPLWTVSYQNSTAKTPATGDADVPFVNMFMTRDPPWAQAGDVGRLTLVAHYDSKITPEGFIGATDSAAPCAMLLHAARSLDDALTRKWAAMKADGLDNGLEEEKGVQILLLDGEEAFVSWTDQDSLYGARSLAEEWEHSHHPALSTYRTLLSSISLFVLLDLLGAADPQVPSYYRSTHWAYKAMVNIETRLRSLSLLQSTPERPFLPEDGKTDGWMGWMVQDDHVPFLHRGVEVLHMIPSPFPYVWHRMEDDGEHLDIPTVDDWAKIVTAFVAEWMDLEGYFDAPSQGSATEGKEKRSASSSTRKTEL